MVAKKTKKPWKMPAFGGPVPGSKKYNEHYFPNSKGNKNGKPKK